MTEPSEFPRPLRAALTAPPLERKGWQWTVAPTYIGLFLWVVFFDQLGPRTLAIGGLPWSLVGAGAGGLLCYLLLYLVPATWGQSTGRPATVLAASTFGATGTLLFTFLLFGLAQVIWIAVSTFYSVDWTLQGLNSCGLYQPKPPKLLPVPLGRGAGRVVELRGTVFLVTSIAWLYAAALVGNYLVRIIQALMNVYPIFPAIMLATAMMLTIQNVRSFEPLEVDPATSAHIVDGGPRAFLMMIQMFFGFFAMAGLAAADWGAVCRTRREVQLGGWVGVAFASWTVAVLALLTVAGALGRYPTPAQLPRQIDVASFTFRVALLLGMPDRVAGSMFLIFGLASLAPTCFAAFLLGQRFSALVPEVSRLKWTLLGATAAWPLVATGLAGRLEPIFTVLGAVFAPMVGAMAGDYVRSRGAWPGPRRGINPAGLLAWLGGFLVGLIPLAVEAGGWGDGSRLQPAAVYGFLTAFLVYTVMARIGLESSSLPIPQVPQTAESSTPGTGVGSGAPGF
jgi:cytosine permease